MNDETHILLAVNADSCCSKALTNEVVRYNNACHPKVSAVYVVPRIDSWLYYSQSPELSGISTLQANLNDDVEAGRDLLQHLSEKFGIAYENLYLVKGSFSKEVKKLAQRIGVQHIVGYHPSLFELVQNSAPSRMVKSAYSYIVTLARGYKLKSN